MKKIALIFFVFIGVLYNVADAQYGNILNFDDTDGRYPYSSLLLLSNKFYACTQEGGVYGYGNIFSIDEDGKNDKVFYNFPSPGYPQIKNELLYVGHKLYGMANGVEANGYGNIFCIDSSGSNYKDIWDFGFPGSPNGCNPGPCSLINVNGRLYGMTFLGGADSLGNIFSIDTDGTHYKDLYDFSTLNGASPEGILILLNKDQLYGTTSLGGIDSEGNVFSIDTAGNNFQDRFDFDFNDGYSPLGSLIVLGARIYGMTGGGGLYYGGNIFSLDTNAHNNSFIDLWDFDGGGDTNGSSPNADLTYSGKSFYGTTVLGGKNGIGNIFRIDTDGTHYTNMWSCSSVNGCFPYANITISKDVMYGTMSGGGTYNKGVIFADTLISLRVTDTSVTCNGGNNGHATVYVSEGTPQFNYSWTGGSTTNKATGLSAGTYTVTVTDANGLVATATATITQPATAVSITVASNTNEACHGDQTAVAIANAAAGGTSPYTYKWAPGGESNLTASDLAAGTYTITATDKNGCTATASVSITQPLALGVTIGSNTNEACNGDQMAVAIANAATGGTTPYTYNWAPGGGSNLTASDLAAGAYTITTTDKNGCTAIASISITQPQALGISIASNTNEACYGDQTASASANVATGGTTPYTYNWAPGGESNLTASDLAAGTYTVLVADAHGCIASADISITQPVASLGGETYSTSDTGSNSGSAAINPKGGTGPYTYYWSPGGETTDSLIHLSAGTYTITLTDKNGCTYSTLVVVNNTNTNGLANISSGQNTQISVYPNPSGGAFTFLLNRYKPLSETCVEIYNILGEQVYSKSLIPDSQFSINLSNQPNGLYMYRIISGSSDLIGQGKLIIQR